MSRLIDELQRRNVVRVGIAYLAVGWLILQVAELLLPVYGFTDAAIRNLVAILAVGLLVALVLAWTLEWTPKGIIKEPGADSAPAPATADRSNRRFDQFIICILVIAVAFFAVDKFVLDPARDAQEIEAATEKARTGALLESYGDKSIAVLAFADMSSAGDQEYFGDGIAEELLNLLASIRDLRVISRSTAFTFKGSSSSLKDIAEKLNVTYILEGSVRKAGDKIRITAQLIHAKSDTHVWSETYDRTLNDVFAIQDEISGSIVEQLKLTILDGSPRAQKIDPKAYEMYLKAQHIVHSSSRSQFREAQSLLNEVLETAPDYIPALNALGRLYYRIPKTDGISAAQNVAEVHALADRVVAIEPDGASALIWQGWFAYTDNEMQKAADFYEKAVRVDPNNTSLLRVLVAFLQDINRADEAIALGHYLLLRDPACAVCINNLASAYRGAVRYADAANTLETILSWHAPMAGFFWSLGVNRLLAGEHEKALEAFQKEQEEVLREMGSLMALHDLGRADEFETRFAGFRSELGQQESIARIYAWVGDNDKAFEWLQNMIDADGPERLRSVDTDLYAKIKSDPRWRAMRDQYGIDDTPVEEIDFDYTLPAGASID